MLLKILTLLFFISNFSFADIKTTDVKVLVELIKSETRANRDLIISNQKATEKRFEDMQRLIVSETKANRDLIISNQKATEKRFESMQRLIVSETKANRDLIIANYKHSEKRFEDMRRYSENRFEDMKKKSDDMLTIMLFGFGLLISIVSFFLIRVIKQEKSIESLTNEVKIIANEVEKSSSKSIFKILVETIETMAKKDDDFKIILRNHNLVLATN